MTFRHVVSRVNATMVRKASDAKARTVDFPRSNSNISAGEENSTKKTFSDRKFYYKNITAIFPAVTVWEGALGKTTL